MFIHSFHEGLVSYFYVSGLVLVTRGLSSAREKTHLEHRTARYGLRERHKVLELSARLRKAGGRASR